MSPRPDVSEERKKQIIDAALNVFSREGFHQARMDDIAQEAGLSKGALYWYFNSKDKIISSLLESFFNREFSKMEEWLKQEGSGKALLSKLIDVFVEDMLTVEPFLAVLYEFWAMSFRNKRVKTFIRESMQRYLDLIAPVVKRGIDQGEFRDLNPHDVSVALGAMIEGSILLWSYDLDNVDFRKMLTNNFSIFLNGIEDPNYQVQ